MKELIAAEVPLNPPGACPLPCKPLLFRDRATWQSSGGANYPRRLVALGGWLCLRSRIESPGHSRRVRAAREALIQRGASIPR